MIPCPTELKDKLVEEGIPLSKIGVAGMSMGACLALHVGYGMGRHAGRSQ